MQEFFIKLANESIPEMIESHGGGGYATMRELIIDASTLDCDDWTVVDRDGKIAFPTNDAHAMLEDYWDELQDRRYS